MKASTEVSRMAFPFTLSSPPQPIGTLSHLAYVSGVEQRIQDGGKWKRGHRRFFTTKREGKVWRFGGGLG